MRSPFRPWLLALSTAGLLGAPPLAGIAEAQPAPLYDHLKCYRLSRQRAESLVVPGPLTLAPVQTGALGPFSTERCVLLPKSKPLPKELCIPVDKDLPGAPAGQNLFNDFLCYAMRCTEPKEADLLGLGVQDQFFKGSTTIKRRSASRRFCVPAIKINFPIPTPTPAPTPFPDCSPTPTPTPPLPPCGPVSGPDQGGPQCLGWCPPDTLCFAQPGTSTCVCEPAAAACGNQPFPQCASGLCNRFDQSCAPQTSPSPECICLP